MAEPQRGVTDGANDDELCYQHFTAFWIPQEMHKTHRVAQNVACRVTEHAVWRRRVPCGAVWRYGAVWRCAAPCSAMWRRITLYA
eukprot:gene10072-biopygen708